MKPTASVLPGILVLLLVVPHSAVGQQTPEEMRARHQTRPEGWEILTDRVGADTTEIYFARMEPGFHLTAGPAALFYDPETSPSGTFRVDASTHLFRPDDGSEGYGIFIGGADLLGSYQRYTSFLVRPGGEFLIRQRISTSSTETLVDWTEHEAVARWDEREAGALSVRNDLSVEVRTGEIVFFVNGDEVARVSRSSLPVEGIAGIRMHPGLDVHVGSFQARALDGPVDSSDSPDRQ